jgi:hypothetical protein
MGLIMVLADQARLDLPAGRLVSMDVDSPRDVHDASGVPTQAEKGRRVVAAMGTFGTGRPFEVVAGRVRFAVAFQGAQAAAPVSTFTDVQQARLSTATEAVDATIGRDTIPSNGLVKGAPLRPGQTTPVIRLRIGHRRRLQPAACNGGHRAQNFTLMPL